MNAGAATTMSATAAIQDLKGNGTFYGPDEVHDVVNNGEYSIVLTINHKRIVIATSEVKNLVLDHATDLTALRRARVNPVAAGAMMLMKMYNLRQDEVEFTLGLVAESLNQNINQASNKLWGVDHFGEQTFNMIDDVLKN